MYTEQDAEFLEEMIVHLDNDQPDMARQMMVDWKNEINKKLSKRSTWQEYFIDVMDAVARRGTCDRGRSGCVIVSVDNRILSTGYVGSPRGLPHCDDVGHEMVNGHCVRTVHAEANAIANAARMGISIEGAILYCRMTPCRKCAELIIQSGITKVITQFKHRGTEGRDLLKKANVELVTLGDLIDYQRQEDVGDRVESENE